MLPLLGFLLIPSRFVPLRATLLISSYLGNTWESLGPQVTSFVSLLPPFPSLYSLCNLGGYPNLFPPPPPPPPFPRVSLSAAPLLVTKKARPQPLPFPSTNTRSLNLTLVAHVAFLNGTSTLAVTSDVTF